MAEQVRSETLLLPTHPEDHHPASTQELLLYKNRLQEFTQRASIPLPVYVTISEGTPHDPQFRSRVEVDGQTYTSVNTFSHRKAAEQDVAKLALEGISQKIKNCVSNKTTDGGFPPIYEDRVFCKAILHEYAAKMNVEKPAYNTVRSEGGPLTVFISSLVFNGVTYRGEACTNKKEAEQLAARAVILSILGNSGAETGLSEIVKSKAKFFSAFQERYFPVPNASVSPGLPKPASDIIETPVRKEMVSGDANQAGPMGLQGQPIHEFRKPTTTGSVSPKKFLPITFVPSIEVEAQQALNQLTSGEKRKLKRKRAAASKKLRAAMKRGHALSLV